MAVWSDLATELVIEVLSHLDDWRDTCLASRQLRDISEVLLYRDVDLSASRKEEGLDAETGRLRQFLCTIVRRPDLGRHVRTLTVDAGAMSELCDIHSFRSVSEKGEGEGEGEAALLDHASQESENDLLLLLSITKRLGLSPKLLQTPSTSLPALVLVAFHHLPRLQSFHCPKPSCISSGLCAAIAGIIPGPLPIALQSLEELDISYPRRMSRKNWCPSEVVTPILTLPKLKTCRLYDVEGYLPATWQKRINGSAIQNLELIHSHIDSSLLQSLILTARKLETFKYTDIGESHYQVPEQHILQCSVLQSALHAHASTLTSLEIRASGNRNGIRVNGNGCIGSLREFPVLRHIKLYAEVLFGSPLPLGPAMNNPPPQLGSLLPPSLVTLDLWLGDRFTIVDLVAATGLPYSLKQTKELLPMFQTLSIHGAFSPLMSRAAMDAVREFRGVGIVMVLPKPGTRIF